MKNYIGDRKWSSLIIILLGLFNTLSYHNVLGPIMMASGVIMFVSFDVYKNKQRINGTVCSMIIVASLALMIIGEYFFVPIQNSIFYVLLLMIAVGTFLTFYFTLISKDRLIRRAKILSWTGAILFGLGLFSIIGLIFNNFTITLILGGTVLITALIGMIVRRRMFKDTELKNEFNEEHSTKKNTKDYWFRYEIGGIPKPLRWQGWVCYSLIFLSPFIVLILDDNPTTSTVIIVASIIIIMIVAFLKSNYRESVREYRENSKKIG